MGGEVIEVGLEDSSFSALLPRIPPVAICLNVVVFFPEKKKEEQTEFDISHDSSASVSAKGRK